MGRFFALVLLLAGGAACGGRSRATYDAPLGGSMSSTASTGGTDTGGTDTGGTSTTGGSSPGGASSLGSGGGGAVPNEPGSGYCPDYIPPVNQARRCHGFEDCSVDEDCIPQNNPFPPPTCTTDCFTATRECETAADCAQGKVCVTGYLPCLCAGTPPPTSCEVPCVPNTCGLNERCNTQSGLCEVWPCSEGYACYVDDVCDPGNPEADANGCAPVRCEDGFECPVNTRCSAAEGKHGCARLPCAADAECDCGACVNATCFSGPGVCATP